MPSVFGYDTCDAAIYALTEKLVTEGQSVAYVMPSLTFRIGGDTIGQLHTVLPLPSYRCIFITRTDIGFKKKERTVESKEFAGEFKWYRECGVRVALVYHKEYVMHSTIAAHVGSEMKKFHIQLTGENNTKTVGIRQLD